MIFLSAKLSLKEIEKIIDKKSVEICELNGETIVFNKNVSCEKIFAFCEQSSNLIFDPDGLYMPKLKDILIFEFMLENMTNVPVKKSSDNNIDIDFIYNFMRSNIGKKINQTFKTDPTYYFLSQELKGIVSYKKEVYLKTIESKSKVMENIDSLINDIKTTSQKISRFIDEHKDITSSEKLNKIVEVLDKVNKENGN